MRILRFTAATALLSGLLAAIITAQGRAPKSAPALLPARQITAIRCGKIYTVANGIVDRGVILIENGRIVEVRKGDSVPDGAKVIDATNQVVIPGLVSAYSELNGYGEADQTVGAELQASDGIDVFEDHWRLLSGGVTTVYVAPGSRRLVTGQGAVAKTAGRSRIVSSSYGLQITLGEAVKNPPPIFKPPLPPSADRPILPAKRQYPSSRMGEFAELRRAFTEAKEADSSMPAARRKPLQEVLMKKRPALITAHTADDIIKAVRFAEEEGFRPILLGAEESFKVADYLAEHKIQVILNGSVSPARKYDSDDSRNALEGSHRFNTAAVLFRTGVTFALQPTRANAFTDLSDYHELLFIAGAAVRWGLSEEVALRSITLTPAELLGVGDHVGAIAPGHDADLVFLNGEPFSTQSTPQRVMVDGEFVFHRKDSDSKTYEASLADASRSKKKEITAIKCGRILTVTQGIIGDGLILIENGKIAYAGQGRPIPKNAKIVDASALTVVPGMLDINSHLGFHLEQDEISLHGFRRGSGNPTGNAVPTSKLVRLDDPVFREAASSGITAILLTPDGAGVCSLIKLTGEKTSVVRDVAAYKFTVTGGTAAYERLKQDLQRARKYHEEWEAYEKSLKEGKETPKPIETESPTKGDPISGTWKGTMEVEQFQMKAEFTADLKLSGTQVTGTITSETMGQSQTEQVHGTFQNNELRIEQEQQGAKITIVLKLIAPNHLKGDLTIAAQGMTIKGTMECKRVAGGEGQPAATGTPGAPKKEPKRDETLDPLRPLFRKEISAIVQARDLPGVENAIKLFRDDFNLDYFLVGVDEVVYAADLLAAKGAGAAFGSEAVIDVKGARLNVAEAVAASGVPVAFYSDATSGARLLPLTAAYAVRHGMDSFDALKALTIHPARMAHADSRLGSIERGHDADLVIFSGGPFELTSRVRMVFIDGKLVYEEK